jgi:hypothetical protein
MRVCKVEAWFLAHAACDEHYNQPTEPRWSNTTMTTYNLQCYRTDHKIPADLAALCQGLRTKTLRLGQRPGQVCVVAGPPVTDDAEQLKAHRGAAAKANPGILTAAGLAPLLKVWAAAGASAEPWEVFADAMEAAGPQPVAVVEQPKPAKPVRIPAPVAAPSPAAVASAKPTKPVKAPAPATVAVPSMDAGIVLTADVLAVLGAIAAPVKASGVAVSVTVAGRTYTVNP